MSYYGVRHIGPTGRINVQWTPEKDRVLRALRDAGLPWTQIGHRMGLTRGAVHARGKVIGALGKVYKTPESLSQRPREGHSALPPGHPHTWGILVYGTLLEGSTYGEPVE